MISDEQAIGFIGLGNMGLPMAQRLVAAGYQVRGFDQSEQARRDFTGLLAADPAAAADGAGAVILMLPDSNVVESVVLGQLAGLPPGSTVIDMSSSDPARTRLLAQRLAESGVTLIDAPVSGGVGGAQAGTLTIMVGGPDAAYERFKPLLSAMGSRVMHAGGTGCGHAVKALNNLMSAANLLVASEALIAGQRFGLDPAVMLEIINGSSGRSNATENKWPNFVLPGEVLRGRLRRPADGQGHQAGPRPGTRGRRPVGRLGSGRRRLGSRPAGNPSRRRPHRHRPLGGQPGQAGLSRLTVPCRAMGGAEGGVFVSYRRDDSSDAAGRLADRLADHFGAERVFIDVETIKPGDDYAEAIVSAIAACRVLVAVIGPGWLEMTGKLGRRLDDPTDWVRIEVSTALAQRLRVIPVLVGGAVMPTREALPDDLAELARRNALPIRYESFRADAGQLVAAIERLLVTVPAAPGADPGRAGRLFDEAERIAKSIADQPARAEALGSVAAAMAVTDPGRSAGLFDDAERIARSIAANPSITKVFSGARKEQALCDLAARAAGADPDRAERIAQSIGNKSVKASALCRVAAAVAAANPGRAGWIFAEAERVAMSISTVLNDVAKGDALAGIAAAIAPTNPGRAERIAGSITSPSAKVRALITAGAAMAATDPSRAVPLFDQAEHIAAALGGDAEALSSVAAALAATDPGRAVPLFDRAEHIANSASLEPYKAQTLSAVAAAVAATDPGRAERIAGSITDKIARAGAIRRVAAALAATDPGRAELIAGSADGKLAKAWALSSVAAALAATDPGRAERIANSIANRPAKARSARAQALSSVAAAVAATDPGRAERIADSITDACLKASILAAAASSLAQPQPAGRPGR